jgi:hypothetical protein
MLHDITVTNSEYLDPKYLSKSAGVTTVGDGHRAYQLEVLEKFKDSQFSSLTAPCGSGKSTVQTALAILDADNNARLQVFAVPQTVIADGFFKRGGEWKNVSIHGKLYKVRVHPENNFCEKADVSRLKEIMLTDRSELMSSGLSGLFVLTTHSALIRAWKRMTADERKVAIHNLHLRVDESHHVAAGGDGLPVEDTKENTLEDKTANELGKICRYVVNSQDESARITLSTATNFRGDLKNIYTSGVFEPYHLDWFEHWPILGIENLHIAFKMFEGEDPINLLVANICKEKNEKHYVAVPPSNASWRSKFEKQESIDKLISAIKSQWHDCHILNLVTPETQQSNKALLLEEPKDGGGKSKLDVVVTCGIGREGLDWVPCSRLHVSYIEGSITLSVQTLGRLLRRYHGKSEIRANYYFPEFPEPKAGMSKHELLDDRKNVILLMTQVEEMFYPIQRNLTVKSCSGTKHVNDLEKGIGSSNYQALKNEFFESAMCLGLSGALTVDSMKAIIENLLEKYHVTCHDSAAHILLALWARRISPKFRAVDVAFVRAMGFSTLVEETTHEGRTLVDCYNLKTQKLLKQIVETKEETMMAWIEKVKATGGDYRKIPILRRWMKYRAIKLGLI